jgi:acetyl coenzyme A synthetase (ADP forming)-like protein
VRHRSSSDSQRELDALFRPRAVAVVGASREPTAIGHKVLRGIVAARFPGPVYPVNPNADELLGLRCYPTARALPGPIDLAVVTVPAALVEGVLEDCAVAGACVLVIVTAGFAELGPTGREKQAALLRRAREFGIRIVGPNCFGVLNTDPTRPLNATFSPRFPPPGPVAMASQSGAIGLEILALAERYGVGVSSFVSMGNKADVSTNDLLEWWEHDPRTGVVLLYLESFGNPARFATIAKRFTRTKPIVALKSGRSASGSRAAGSHTAALAASDVAVDALFAQTGVLRAGTVEQLFHAALGLGCQPLPRGSRVAVVTNAGGPAILATDACEAEGLSVAPLSTTVQSALRRLLPAEASVTNPVDLVASAGPKEFRVAVEILLGAEEVDALLILYTVIDRDEPPELLPELGRALERARANGGAGKPVLLAWMKEGSAITPVELGGERVPRFRFPEEAAYALGKMHEAAVRRAAPEPRYTAFPETTGERLRAALGRLPAEERWLKPEEICRLLEAAGIPLVSGGVATSEAEAGALAERLSRPVALKLLSQDVTHKTDVGGVLLDVEGGAAAREGFRRIRESLARHRPDARFDGVLVQAMERGGIEVFLGMTRDTVFGPLVGFGLGGVLVEILSDVRFRLAPLSDQDARTMIREIRGSKLLEGYRGRPAADIPALEELLLRLSRLVEQLPEIDSLDLNPVLAREPGKGCCVLDARVHWKPRVDSGNGTAAP